MLIVVEGPQSGSGLFILRNLLDQTDHDVAFVTANPAVYSASDRELLNGRRVALVRVDSTDPNASTSHAAQQLRTLDQLGSDTGIICLTDRHMTFAADLAATLSVPFTPATTIRTLRNKAAARAAYEHLGIANVRWAPVNSMTDAESFVATHGPAVIKNTAGTGSMQVMACASVDAVPAVWDALSRQPRYLNAGFLIEEALRGPMFSAEVLISDGAPLLLGFTDRTVGRGTTFPEVGATYPVDLGPALTDAVQDLIRTLVSGLGLRRIALHIEFIVTADGPRIVEVNCRLAGSLVPLMIESTLDESLPELLANTALGRPLPLTAHHSAASAIRIVYAEKPGTLETVLGDEDVNSAPFVEQNLRAAGPGDQVSQAIDYRGVVRIVRTVAPTAALAGRAAESAGDLLTAVVRSDEGTDT